MSRPTRRHGTRSRYVSGCRCPECSQAQREYGRHYYQTYRKPLEGIPNVSPDRARAHVDRLRAAGMGLPSIAAAAGLHESVVAHLYRAQSIRPKTEQAILSVKLTTFLVPADATRRRIQALARIGWAMEHLSAESGVHLRILRCVSRGQGSITRERAEAIAAAFERLSMRLGPSVVARQRAERKGWAPPLAYDNIDSDDGPVWDPARCSVPECNAPSRSRGLCGRHYARLNRRLRKSDADDTLDEIAITRAIDRGGVTLTTAERLEVIRRMAAAGHSDPTIAEHCGCTHRTVERVRQVNGIASRWQRSVA